MVTGDPVLDPNPFGPNEKMKWRSKTRFAVSFGSLAHQRAIMCIACERNQFVGTHNGGPNKCLRNMRLLGLHIHMQESKLRERGWIGMHPFAEDHFYFPLLVLKEYLPLLDIHDYYCFFQRA